MDGDWESDRLDETFDRLLSARLDTKIRGIAKLQFLGLFLRSLLFNRQSRKRRLGCGLQAWAGAIQYPACSTFSLSLPRPIRTRP